jgi:hypothetical protein
MLLDRGDYTDEEIARFAETTTANVYKEKSQYTKETGKKFRVSRYQTTNIKTKTPSAASSTKTITTTTSMAKKLSIGPQQNLHLNAPPLNQDQLRIFYKAFNEEKDPAQVIAETGLNPEAVEIEYSRCLWLRRRVPPQIASAILNAILASSPVLENVRKKFNETTELDLKELENALYTNNSFQMINGFNVLADTILMNTNIPLPQSVHRSLCNDCKYPVPGVIYKDEKFIAWRVASYYLFCPNAEVLEGQIIR